MMGERIRAERMGHALISLCRHADVAVLLRLFLCVCLLGYGSPAAGAGHWHESHQYEYHSGAHPGCDGDDDDSDVDLTLYAMLAGLGAYVGTAPWWAPPKVIDDDYDVRGRFPHHPYEDGHGGFMLLDDDPTLSGTRVGDFFFRGTVDGGTNFSGIDRIGTHLHLETRGRLGFDVGWATYNVDPGSNAPDDFDVADANVIYRFGQSEHAQWWTGVGMSWLNEAGVGTKYGYNFTYGADACVGDPWIVSLQLDAGEIQHNSYFHARATIGAQWKGVEVFTGFDYIDANVSDAATIVAGLRIWF